MKPRKIFGLFFLVVLLLIVFPVFLQAAQTPDPGPDSPYPTIQSLISKAGDFDGQTVLIKGEAIGDLMKRVNGTWVNISDGSAAIGIFFKKDEIASPAVNFLGDYDHRGDILEITGTFNKACRFHEGELDIHAQKIKVLEPGRPINHQPDNKKIKLAGELLLGALLLAGLVSLKSRRPAKKNEQDS